MISGNTVCVNDFLERSCKSVCFDVSGAFSFGLHLPKWYKGRKNLIQESSFLFFDPDFTDHNIVSFFQKIHSFKNERLLFKQNSKGLESGTSKLFSFDSWIEVLPETFFCHSPELFSISYAILNLFDFIKHFILVGWKAIFFGRETFAYSVDFVYQDISWFDDHNEGWSWNVIGVSFRWGVESIKNGVTLWCSEDHFGEFVQIFSMNDTWNVDKFKLREAGLIQVDFLLISSGTTEDLSCFEEKIFIIFKFDDFFLVLNEAFGKFVKSDEFGFDFLLDFIQKA